MVLRLTGRIFLQCGLLHFDRRGRSRACKGVAPAIAVLGGCHIASIVTFVMSMPYHQPELSHLKTPILNLPAFLLVAELLTTFYTSELRMTGIGRS